MMSNIKNYAELKGQIENQEKLHSALKVLLVFEVYQPSIGYVPGIEKIALFLVWQLDEATAWEVLHNILFSSKLLWAWFEGKKTMTELNLQLLEKMVTRVPQIKTPYEINKAHLERFILEHAPILFLDVLDSNTVSRIVDHFSVYGEGVLFLIIEIITEELGDTDISELSPLQGREYLASVARCIDPVRIAHKLLTSLEEYEYFQNKKREIVK